MPPPLHKICHLHNIKWLDIPPPLHQTCPLHFIKPPPLHTATGRTRCLILALFTSHSTTLSSEPGVVYVREHADTVENINLNKFSSPWLPDAEELPDVIPPKGLSAENTSGTRMKTFGSFVLNENITCPFSDVPKLSSSTPARPPPAQTSSASDTESLPPPPKRGCACGIYKQDGHNSCTCPNKVCTSLMVALRSCSKQSCVHSILGYVLLECHCLPETVVSSIACLNLEIIASYLVYFQCLYEPCTPCPLYCIGLLGVYGMLEFSSRSRLIDVFSKSPSAP